MHAERVARLGRRRRMAGCHNPPGKHQKPHPAHAVLCGGCGAGATSPSFKRWGRSACACRSEEHTSELQSLMRISYAVFCLKKKKTKKQHNNNTTINHKTTNTNIST